MTFQIVEPRVEQSRLAKVLEWSISSYNEICNSCPTCGDSDYCVDCPIEAYRNRDNTDAQRLYNQVKASGTVCRVS